jgi:GNAT superfamily N-acetyltransferase
MIMISYRLAKPEDEAAIAKLHAESWQKHYRGIFSDAYLDEQVVQERADLWAERFAHPIPNREILLAKKNGQLVGFACIEINEDPVFGTLLDNLHVSREVQGQGIGAQLMERTAQLAESRQAGLGYYLWVLEDNQQARKFYALMGATNHETVAHENPDGGTAMVCRYIWRRTEAVRLRKK